MSRVGPRRDGAAPPRRTIVRTAAEASAARRDALLERRFGAAFGAFDLAGSPSAGVSRSTPRPPSTARSRRPGSQSPPASTSAARANGSSTILHCLPVGTVGGTPGTVMRADTVRRYAREAGFGSIEIAPIEHDSSGAATA